MIDNPIVSWFDTLTYDLGGADRDASVLVLEVGTDASVETSFSTWVPANYRTQTVQSEAAAHDQLAENVDVAVLDRRALEGDGVEGLRRMRREAPETRIVVVTAAASDGGPVESLADAILQRPMAEATFRGVLRSLVERDSDDEREDEIGTPAATDAGETSGPQPSDVPGDADQLLVAGDGAGDHPGGAQARGEADGSERE